MEEIKKMMEVLLREILLAEQKFIIMDEIAYKVSGSKHSKILVPIVDALASSVIVSLHNIYNKKSDAINFSTIIDSIVDYQKENDNGTNVEYFEKLKDKVIIDGDMMSLLLKISKTRSKKYAHLSKDFYLENKFNDPNYMLNLIEVKNLLDLALNTIKDMYRVFTKTDIIYSDVDLDGLKLYSKMFLSDLGIK